MISKLNWHLVFVVLIKWTVLSSHNRTIIAKFNDEQFKVSIVESQQGTFDLFTRLQGCVYVNFVNIPKYIFVVMEYCVVGS